MIFLVIMMRILSPFYFSPHSRFQNRGSLKLRQDIAMSPEQNLVILIITKKNYHNGDNHNDYNDVHNDNLMMMPIITLYQMSLPGHGQTLEGSFERRLRASAGQMPSRNTFEAERLWQCFECLWIDFNRHNFPPSLKIICSLLSPPCGGREIFPVHPYPPPSLAINFHFIFPPPIISISTTNDFHFRHHNNFHFSISTTNIFHFHHQ